MARSGPDFATIRSEGALLPPDLLGRIQANDRDLPHLNPASYHLPGGMRLNEAASRAWNALRGAWATFEEARARLPEDEPGISVTRQRWLLPLFQELGYGRLEARDAVDIEGKSYALSHRYKHAPIHLVGCNVPLDARTRGVAGAASGSPHSLLQELLNRRDDHLWGAVSNGLRLRILRDNLALTRQAYLEFDLEAMMRGEAYSDFVVLYLLLHQSRLEAEDPHECVLEVWSQEAAATGTRVLRDLADGVERAIAHLGQGFLADRGNDTLKAALRKGELATQDYYRQLLRLVYRLLFLFVAEDRDALHPPEAGDEARQRYAHYGTRRLRDIADRLRGGRHPDAFERLKAVFRALGGDGAPALGLPALGSFLFSDEALPDLMAARLPNAHLYAAVSALAYAVVDGMRRPVDYKNLGSEELGGVYEGLLELHPEIDATAGTFTLGSAAGNERKTTGSYYTPSSLISLLLDSTLDPVLDQRTEGKTAEDAEQAVLETTVVDPACGSGHFLIAAAQRMGKRLARIRTGDDEPAPEEARHAIRDVVNRCLYGVDVNPMSAELCKFALWMEALEPGKPLSFLEHRIQVGNSLLGATPDLIAGGIPDDAFKPIEGDEKKVATAIRKRNREVRGGQGDLFDDRGAALSPEVVRAFAELEHMPAETIEQVRAKEARMAHVEALEQRTIFQRMADAWCAAFVWPLRNDTPAPVTTGTVRALADGRALDSDRMRILEALRENYAFFHWPGAFPEVFGDDDGFDVILGNPPWEHVELKEKEWFATREPTIADARTGADRKRRIETLSDSNPALHAEFKQAKRQHEGIAFFAAKSGRYPLTGRGRINTYPLFAELAQHLTGTRGRSGIVVPSGIATDANTQYFFQDVMDGHRLASLLTFDNRHYFSEVGMNQKQFALLTMTGVGNQVEAGRFMFYLSHVRDSEDRHRLIELSPQDIALINPNTKTCPMFRSRRDAEITKDIYRRVPVLVNEATGQNPWGVSFRQGLFNMTSDSHLFRTQGQLEGEGFQRDGNHYVMGHGRYVPLYEAKMIHQFDHRFATYEDGTIRDVTEAEHADPDFASIPRYWVAATEVGEHLEDQSRPGTSARAWSEPWFLGFRDITNSTNERTAIFSVLPQTAVSNKLPLWILESPEWARASLLLATVSSFAFDYVARQSIGGTSLNFYIVKQLPVLAPDTFSPADHEFVRPRVDELVATDCTMAKALTKDGNPRAWDSERRFWLRAELDAFFFHEYGLDRDDTAYIMETFPIVRRRDEEACGHYRTRDAILEVYDDLQRSYETGEKYRTRLDPPAGAS